MPYFGDMLVFGGVLFPPQMEDIYCQESVEEGAQSLPSFLSPSQRLPGTSNSTLLMRVDTAEDGSEKRGNENVKRAPIPRAMFAHRFVGIGCYLHIHI